MKTVIRTAETHPLTWRLRDDKQPVWLDEYQSKNGYAGARKALGGMAPDDIVNAVKDSGLKGRGGAGFSTGLKWSLMPKDESMNIRYLLCNADEMEPGTYKDRLLMEQLPHLLVEGMLISACALKAYRGYIFLRGEYIEAARNLRRAIAEATAAGLLGKNILGTGFDFELFVHTGAGRYICGEETALINSLEGRRANPRSKPPFPARRRRLGQADLRQQRRNPVQRAGHRRERRGVVQGPRPSGQRRHAGTKLMGFSGRVKNPGVWELPFGPSAPASCSKTTPAACAMASSSKPGSRAAPVPTSSCRNTWTRCSTPAASARQAAVWVPRWRWRWTTSINMVSLVRNLEEFFARESCGWCTPCRDGLPWSVKILRALERGEGQPGDLETLEQLVNFLGPGKTFCAHAPGAVEPLQSAIKYFRDEFEAGISRQAQAVQAPRTVGA